MYWYNVFIWTRQEFVIDIWYEIIYRPTSNKLQFFENKLYLDGEFSLLNIFKCIF